MPRNLTWSSSFLQYVTYERGIYMLSVIDDGVTIISFNVHRHLVELVSEWPAHLNLLKNLKAWFLKYIFWKYYL